MENNVQAVNNSVHDVIFEAQEQSTELLIGLQRLKSLLHFLGELFELETLNPNSPNERTRTRSQYVLAHYREYQSLFEIAFNTVHDLNSSVDTLSDTISAALDGMKKETRELITKKED
ncbi:MAG: hypothetical protein IJY93_01845 [Clostridia bacterium]|nr:hypothetical protein [Clostridia bacterium]